MKQTGSCSPFLKARCLLLFAPISFISIWLNTNSNTLTGESNLQLWHIGIMSNQLSYVAKAKLQSPRKDKYSFGCLLTNDIFPCRSDGTCCRHKLSAGSLSPVFPGKHFLAVPISNASLSLSHRSVLSLGRNTTPGHLYRFIKTMLAMCMF